MRRKSEALILIAALALPGCLTSEQLVDLEIPEHSATIPVSRENEKGWLWRHNYFNAVAEKGEVDLVFLGDSITHYWESFGKEVWAEYYGDRKAVNFGCGADRTQHVLWRIDNGNFDGLINPKLIVLLIGTNNHARNSAGEIADGVIAIVQRLRRKLPKTKILMLAIFPRNKRPQDPSRQKVLAANEIFKEIADGNSIFYLDIGENLTHEDGTISREIMEDYLHLTERGYRIWAEGIEETLSQLLGETAGARRD